MLSEAVLVIVIETASAFRQAGHNFLGNDGFVAIDSEYEYEHEHECNRRNGAWFESLMGLHRRIGRTLLGQFGQAISRISGPMATGPGSRPVDPVGSMQA